MASLASLLKKTHIEDDEEVLNAANAALKASKGDLDAQHAKVVALLKLDRYDDAIKTLEAGGPKLKEKAALEHAYALYKSGSPKVAAEEASQGSGRAFKHVEAQAQYKTEDFKKAAELYKLLNSDPEEDAVADLRVNTGAVDAQLEWSRNGQWVQKKKPGREDLEAFETAYNAACASIARGELGQGEVLLKRAKDLCSSLDDLSEEEKEAELLSITIQQIFVLTRLGRLEDAASLAQKVDVAAIPDPITQHIAQVNQLASSIEPANPFLAQRLTSQNIITSKDDSPFGYQTTIMRRNQDTLSLQSLKFGGTAASTAATLCKQTAANADEYHNSLSVVNAAAHAKGQTGKEALKHILPILERRPEDVGLILTITQLYVLTGNLGSAISLLESFLARLGQSGSTAEDVRFAPGLVGTLVSLYESQGRKTHVRTELARAATYWIRKSRERPQGVLHLLKHAGRVLLESHDETHLRLAREIFTGLHEQDPQDRYVAAGLLAASPEHATKDGLAALTPVERHVAGIDADRLESAGIAQPAPSSHAAVTVKKRPAEEAKAGKAKKIRQNRIPKDYDPNKKPDPERWLPLRDRSTYKPKGKKGKARQALLSQGAVANDSDGSRPATPGGEVVRPKQGGGGGANKKKKGKGGKW